MQSVDPVKVYGAQVYCAPLQGTVGNNRTVVTAVTGKRIRVMGWMVQAVGGAIGSIAFKSASGGTFLTTNIVFPPNTTGIPDKMPITDSGYFETNTGEGLFVDIATVDVYLNVFYITYYP